MQVMSENKPRREAAAPGDIAEQISQLGSRNGMARQHAREALVRRGDPAVGPLIAALSADRAVVRWEAAKAFTELHAPEAASPLVKTLTDKNGDVRWLAAEALVGLRETSLVPLFESLMAYPDSTGLREGAHHVLRALNHGELADIVNPVLQTLEHYEPELAVPFSAEEALAKLEKRRS